MAAVDNAPDTAEIDVFVDHVFSYLFIFLIIK